MLDFLAEYFIRLFLMYVNNGKYSYTNNRRRPHELATLHKTRQNFYRINEYLKS